MKALEKTCISKYFLYMYLKKSFPTTINILALRKKEEVISLCGYYEYISYSIIHYIHQSACFLITDKLPVSSKTAVHFHTDVQKGPGPSRRQSCLAGDHEGVQRLLALCSLQRSTSRQNLAGSQFMIESVEHLQDVGFPMLRVAARLQSA